MEKSKIGIPNNLFSAILYCLGTGGNVLTVMIAAGYTLLFEENRDLKRTAVKALIITIILYILYMLTMALSSFLSTFFTYLNSFFLLNIDKTNPGSSVYTNIFYFLQLIPSIIEIAARVFSFIIPVVLGFKAYKQKELKLKKIDKIIID